MSMYQIKSTQRLPIDLATAWDFFSSPKNLAKITPAELDFQIKSELPEKMYEGVFIRYTVRPLFGIPVEWVTEITHIDEGRYFVDEQRVGPYKIWHHQHWFKEIPGGVEMTDQVDYAIPFGPLGTLAQHLIVGKKVQQIFEYRTQVLEEMFGKL